MKPSRPFLLGAYGLAGFVVAFFFLFWLVFRWLHWGYTMWLLDSGDWVFYDGSFSILFGLLIAAVPFSAHLAYPLGQTNRSEGTFRALLWFIAAVVFFGPCVYYQHRLESSAKLPAYPDILVWPVLYSLAAATGAVVFTGWAARRKHVRQKGEKHAA
jgi:hypothetical protein